MITRGAQKLRDISNILIRDKSGPLLETFHSRHLRIPIETIRHFPGDLATFKVSGQTDRGIEGDVTVARSVGRPSGPRQTLTLHGL